MRAARNAPGTLAEQLLAVALFADLHPREQRRKRAWTRCLDAALPHRRDEPEQPSPLPPRPKPQAAEAIRVRRTA